MASSSRFLTSATTLLWLVILSPNLRGDVVLETDGFRVVVDQGGRVASLFSRIEEIEYLARDRQRSLLRLRAGGRFVAPARMLWNADTGGCHDGLQSGGVNANQGAESTLSFLLALTDMSALDSEIRLRDESVPALPTGEGPRGSA